MPKGIRKDGTPNKPPGRPNRDLVKRGPFYFDAEVNQILDQLPAGVTITDFVSEAIKEKAKRYGI